MKCKILHESKGRMRVHLMCGKMNLDDADVLEYYLKNVDCVTDVKVYDRTQDAVIFYSSNRPKVIKYLAQFSFAEARKLDLVPTHTSRSLNREFEDKLVFSVIGRAFTKLFLPAPVRMVITLFRAIKYIKAGIKALIKGKLSVSVLDATAVAVSLIRRDFNTAASVMFMLHIGEILEEWTHKKSVADLAGAMSLNVDKVWLKAGEQEVLSPIGKVAEGDLIIVRTGNMIPLDGKVVSGEASVNQSSITGESLPLRKGEGSYVYAGTVVEEGECIISVDKVSGSGQYDRVVRMIEESEKLKSTTESRASRLADKLVPYTLGGTVLTYLLTRNVTKMLAVLMVDFSCALKLSMPITVLSAMRECNDCNISVKGGKFLEAVAKADTIVFDKTGTLTKGVFAVKDVYSVIDKDELIKYAAYAEFYSTHPIAVSVKNAYKNTVDTAKISNYTEISGMGISADIDGHKVLAGNGRLLESNNISHEKAKSHIGSIIYIAVDGKFAGYIVISDEIKADSKAAISALKQLNIKSVMLTGDVKKNADYTAEQIGIDKVYSQLLPQDKVSKLEEILSSKNHKKNVAFVGDGINDAPVLMRSDVGIAMGGIGSDSAIEAADVVLMTDEPSKIAKASKISAKTMSVIIQNIVFAIGVKVLVMILSVLGISTMWLAIFADVGVSVIAILNAIRAMNVKKYN